VCVRVCAVLMPMYVRRKSLNSCLRCCSGPEVAKSVVSPKNCSVKSERFESEQSQDESGILSSCGSSSFGAADPCVPSSLPVLLACNGGAESPIASGKVEEQAQSPNADRYNNQISVPTDETGKALRFERVRSRSAESMARLSTSLRRTISRSLSRRLSKTTTFTRSFEEMMTGLDPPVVPDAEPVSEGYLEQASMAQIRDAIESPHRGVFERFLRQVLECREISASSWDTAATSPELDIRRQCMSYRIPTPCDVPEFVRNLVNMPALLPAATITWYKSGDLDQKQLVLMQRCYSEGALYTDRFHVEYTLTFDLDVNGGVLVRQWAQVIWTKALPWTHHFLAKILEKRVKGEAREKFEQLFQLIAESMMENNEQDYEDEDHDDDDDYLIEISI